MTNIGGKRGRFYNNLAVGVAAIALTGGVAGAASAQAIQEETKEETKAAIALDISKGDLTKSLTQLGRQARVQIAFLPDRVRGRRASALRGTFTVEEALDRLLAGTGLRYQRTPGGSYVVGGPSEEAFKTAMNALQDINASNGYGPDGKSKIPEILVVGRRWTLNTDIPRTRDDALPYVVFSHEQIVSSGATSLDDFFRDQLGANTVGSTSLQQNTTKGQSMVNLRGLGPDATLILVDGRRYPGANRGDGVLDQSSVNGIPLDAIERVEVLSSSAAGIYGGNAVGGVINIIMRRDYKGLEATAYYGNTSDFKAGEVRLSLNGSFALEHGKTNVSFSGEWHRTDPLYEGARDFTARGRALGLSLDPNYYTDQGVILGSTPNIASQTGAALVLKPAYGGAALGSSLTFIPKGFAGQAQAGKSALGAALLANAGKQNTELPDVATGANGGNGTLAPLLSQSRTWSGSVAVKREFNSWLRAYGEFGYSRYESSYLANPVGALIPLSASAPDNPFLQAINVMLPAYGQGRPANNVSTNKRVLAGAIITLPFGWQANLDASWSYGTFRSLTTPPSLDAATGNGLLNGTTDILKDVAQFPISYGYDPAFGSSISPSNSFTRTYSLKLAGKAPWLRLWGGKPIMTLLLEQDRQATGDSISIVNQYTGSSISYTPSRWQRTNSAYGEVAFPIIGAENHVPLIRALDLQVSARYDGYAETGANASLVCVSKTTPLTDSDRNAPCPPRDPVTGAELSLNGSTLTAVPRTTARHSAVNPVVALKWTMTPDIAFRGSYTTGYQPPTLTQLVSTFGPFNLPFLNIANAALVNVTDPLRGNEIIGTNPFGIPGVNFLSAKIGGNADVLPQTSTSWSAGTIVTPRFLPGFRFSVDWTRITQRNLYFSPQFVLSGNVVGGQQEFNDFLAAFPERFTRAAPVPGDPYKVGKIIFVDATLANFSMARSEALDFAGSYVHDLFGGQIDVEASATLVLKQDTQLTANSPIVNSKDLMAAGYLSALAANGGVDVKGVATIAYSTRKWSVGWRVKYFNGYWLLPSHQVAPLQGSARIPAQAYNDIFASWLIFPKTQLRAGVNNVFHKEPPIDIVGGGGTYYSRLGDPRLTNFYLSIKQSF